MKSGLPRSRLTWDPQLCAVCLHAQNMASFPALSVLITHIRTPYGSLKDVLTHEYLADTVLCAGEAEGTTGMLVVDSVIPDGPSDGLLEPGDVLVRIQGQVIVHFLPMEALLDDHVGQRVTVEIERGGELLQKRIQVGAPAWVPFEQTLYVMGGL